MELRELGEGLRCSRCGEEFSRAQIVKIELPNGGHHLKVCCPNCGRFVRFLRHAKPKILWFGKYKGEQILAVAKKDRQYLEWLLNLDLRPPLRESIEAALEGSG